MARLSCHNSCAIAGPVQTVAPNDLQFSLSKTAVLSNLLTIFQLAKLVLIWIFVHHDTSSRLAFFHSDV
jgi:hypothetical protein